MELASTGKETLAEIFFQKFERGAQNPIGTSTYKYLVPSIKKNSNLSERDEIGLLLTCFKLTMASPPNKQQ